MKKLSFLMVALFTVIISTQAHAWSTKVSSELQTYFGIPTNLSNAEKLRQTKEALQYHVVQVDAEIARLTQGTSSPTILINTPSILTAVTNNGVTNAITGVFNLDIQATGRGDMFVYDAEVVLRNAQTGAFVSSSTVKLIPNESGNDIPVQHKTYGNITVSRVAEGASKRFTAQVVVKPTGNQTVNYVMQIRNMRYFGSDFPAAQTTAVAKNILLEGLQNSRTNTVTYDGTSPSNSRRTTVPAAPANATSGQAVPILKTSFFGNFVKNLQAQVLYMFGK